MPEPTALALTAEQTEQVTLLLAAIYACAGRLDKDELTDDAGEPLRTIGNKLEEILGLDIRLDEGFLLERGQEYAESAELGLAYDVDHHIMPTAAVRDRLDDVNLADVLLAAHRDAAVGDATIDQVISHLAVAVRAALLGEATQ